MKYTLITLVTLSLSVPAWASNWKLDKAHSRVGFSVKHLGISNVSGNFHNFTANIKADSKHGKLQAVTGVVQVDSVDTDIEKRDNHLKAEDFFHAKKYPKMKLELKKITWNGDKFTATTMLTIKNKTKKIIFTGHKRGPQKVNLGQGDQLRVGYTANAQIDRHAFGLSFNAIAEGVSVVGKTVTIVLDMEFYQAI